MKYIFPLALVAMSKSGLAMAHDSSVHVDTAWYQDTLVLASIVGLIIISVALASMSYWYPQNRNIFAGIGIVGLLVGLVWFQVNQSTSTQVQASVVISLTGVPAMVYRTEGCSCCTSFAKELQDTGAQVTVETITATQMQEFKRANGIAPEQESCHTSIIDGYVVEGHVPFAAIAQLVENRPDILGVTLPGMPMGTPGMPGKQSEVHAVTTLENELFWQSS